MATEKRKIKKYVHKISKRLIRQRRKERRERDDSQTRTNNSTL